MIKSRQVRALVTSTTVEENIGNARAFAVLWYLRVATEDVEPLRPGDPATVRELDVKIKSVAKRGEDLLIMAR